MELKIYALLVMEMRSAQKEYFKARKAGLNTVAAGWLDKSKQKEKEVDTATAEIFEVPKPPDLFNNTEAGK